MKNLSISIGHIISGVICAIVAFALFSWLDYVAMPYWSATFIDSWWYGAFRASVYACCLLLALWESYSDFSDHPVRYGICTGFIVIPWIVAIIVSFISGSNGLLFDSKTHWNYVAEKVTVVTAETATEEEVNAIEAIMIPDLMANGTDNLPLYGIPEADSKSQTLLGANPGLGSQMEIQENEWTTQCINNEIYYVNALEPIDMFKWDKTVGNGGYFMVNRNNGKAEFVQESMLYTLDAPFGSKVKRVMMEHLGKNEGIAEITPERDDNGKVFYVASLYTQEKLGSIKIITGILVLDAVTGDVERYTVEEAPEWVDRIYPEEFFLEYIDVYGRYANGWKNAHFKKLGVQVATSDYDIVYVDGACYAYTGWTTEKAGADSASSNGIMMMNLKNGQLYLYNNYGISESKAQSVAEDKVQEKGYTASYPILLTLAEEPTYFMLMRGNGGNLTGYAFVSYKDYTKVAVAETVAEAQTLYFKAVATSNTSDSLDSSALTTVDGIITAIGDEVVEGTTMYYVRLEGSNVVYRFTSTICIDIVFANVGDRISVSFIPTTDTIVPAVEVNISSAVQ